MSFFNRTRRLLGVMAVLIAVGLPTTIALTSVADARIGGGFSSGSRGMRTFSAPPVTRTAPSTAQPMQRSATQPGSFSNPAATTGGFFSRPGLLGGLAAGFLGAGLFGLLFGGGLFGGLGGLSSLFGLLIQVALIVIVARLVIGWWRRRNAPAYAGMSGGPQSYQRDNAGSGVGGGLGSGIGGFGTMFGGNTARTVPLSIAPADYDAFERLLGQIQNAWSNEDALTLQRLATPEMAGYFVEDLASNKSRGVVNKVSGVKLEQGDLAEAWREGDTDYATVAMRFSLVDKTIERASGRIVEGSDQPQKATEVWTFRRDRGGDWVLSAIQQST